MGGKYLDEINSRSQKQISGTIDGLTPEKRTLCSYDLAVTKDEIFACNYIGNTIEVLDLHTLDHTGRRIEIEKPHGIWQKDNEILVAGYRNGLISRLNLMNGTVSHIPTGNHSWPVSAVRIENYYYFADYRYGAISAIPINPKVQGRKITSAVLNAQKPHSIKTTNGGWPAIVTAREPSAIILLQRDGRSKQWQLKDNDPLSAAWTPRGIFFTCYKHKGIFRLDPLTGQEEMVWRDECKSPTGIECIKDSILFTTENTNEIFRIEQNPSLRCK